MGGLTRRGGYYFVGNANRETSDLVAAGDERFVVGRVYLGRPRYAAHSFRLAFAGHYTKYWDEHPRETPLPSPITIEGISIGHGATDDPARATWLAGTFDGSAQAVVEASPSLPGVLSDDVVAAGAPVPAGHHVWAMVAAHVPAGGTWPQARIYGPSRLEGLRSSTASLAVHLLDGAGVALPPGTVRAGFAPTYVVAQGSEGEAVVLTYGDSIAWSQYDSALDVEAHGDLGFVQRGLAAAGVAGHLIALPSAMGSHWVRNGRTGSVGAKIDLLKRLPNLPFTHVLSEIGTNDFENWPTAEAFIEGQKAVLRLLRGEFPDVPVFQTTMLPRGRTADHGTSREGQTPDPQTDPHGGNLAAFNEALGVGALGDVADAGVDISSPVEDPADPRRWASRSETLTLVAPASAGATQIDVRERPRLGDVYAVAGASRVVASVGGEGPFRVTLNGALARDCAAGTVFRATNSDDALHPSTQGHRLIAPVIEAWARGLVGRSEVL